MSYGRGSQLGQIAGDGIRKHVQPEKIWSTEVIGYSNRQSNFETIEVDEDSFMVEVVHSEKPIIKRSEVKPVMPRTKGIMQNLFGKWSW